MANPLYILLTLLKAIAMIYIGVFVAKNIWPAIKNNDRKKLRKIGMRILFTFLFFVVLTVIEFVIVFSK